MKTVGIITIQKAPENYGAALQAYALWKFLQSKGYDCKLIDLLRPWHPKYKYCKKDSKKNTTIKARILRVLRGNKAGKKMLSSNRCKEFDLFHSKCNYTRQYDSVDSLYANPPVFDIYISGSDQIWNPNMNLVNEPYFLSFAPQGAKKISYASSFAIQELPSEVIPDYTKWLSGYDYISVREEDGLEIIRTILPHKEAQVVLDPTFLLQSTDWSGISKNTDKGVQDYMFVYLLHDNCEINKYIHDIAEKYSLQVKMAISKTYAEVPNQFESLMDIGPEEWLGYIKNAKNVITDSFHCTVFSLIFKKPFLTISTNDSVSSRMRNMLDKFGLSNNLVSVSSLHTRQFEFPLTDYSVVTPIIEKERQKSIFFLTSALK